MYVAMKIEAQSGQTDRWSDTHSILKSIKITFIFIRAQFLTVYIVRFAHPGRRIDNAGEFLLQGAS